MNPFELQVFKKTEETPCSVAESFLTAFATGRLQEAHALTTAEFEWFGTRLTDASWSSPDTKAFVAKNAMAFDKYRDVPGGMIAAFAAEADELFGGAIGEPQYVVLADGQRGDAEFTVAVLLENAAGKYLVRRVFDPESLAKRVIELARPE